MEVKGKILEIFDTQEITATFKKREFVIEYAENPQYPEFVKFELIQDKCSLLDDYKTDQEVNVFFNLKGRKWVDPQGQTKYFNSLQAWRVTAVEAAQPEAQTPPPPTAEDAPAWLDTEQEDDLPF